MESEKEDDEEIVDINSNYEDDLKLVLQNSFIGYKTHINLLETIYFNLKQISSDYSLTEGEAFRLLNLNKWDLQKTIDYINDVYTFPDFEIPKEEGYCPICYEDLKLNNKEKLNCGHCFCIDCFLAYINESIKEGPSCINKTCPNSLCKQNIGPSLFRKYLYEANKKNFEKYERFLVDNFVLSSQNLKWCPGKDCKKAIDLGPTKNFKISQNNIKCECGCSFCLSCEKEAHMPASCDQFANWMSILMGKNNKVDDLWMKVHTKKCPHCKINIEKNQGCMHMTCKNCSYEFCWLCLGDWKNLHNANTGGFYKCNIYKEDQKLAKELTETEKEIERLNFYMDRYHAHQDSLRKAEEKKVKKCEEFIMFNCILKTYEDEKMLSDALDLLIECRRCISYTYVIAFFLGPEKKDFFEFLQHELESNVDNLDELTDQEFNSNFAKKSKTFIEWKNKVKCLKEVLKSYSENILSDLEKNLPDLKIMKKPSLHTGKTLTFFEKQNQEDLHWYCIACTFGNTPDKTLCDMCGTRRNDQF